MFRPVAFIFAALLSHQVLAQQLLPPSSVIPKLGDTLLRDAVDQVKAVKRIPVNFFTMIETNDGKVFLVSDNGRLAILGGRWIDLWEGQNITNIADSASLDKVNFARMGIDLQEFSPFVVGHGPQSIAIFVDPTDDHARQLVRSLKPYYPKYTFNIILAPLNGEVAGTSARRMHCSPDKALALDAFLNNAIRTLPVELPTCDPTPVQKAMLTALIMGFRQSPFVILPDKTTLSGPSAVQALHKSIVAP